jgi:hypothetical protein
MLVNTPPTIVAESVGAYVSVTSAAEAVDVPPFPLLLTDWTVNVYCVFGLRLVNTYGYTADVCGVPATADTYGVKMLLVAP